MLVLHDVGGAQLLLLELSFLPVELALVERALDALQGRSLRLQVLP